MEELDSYFVDNLVAMVIPVFMESRTRQGSTQPPFRPKQSVKSKPQTVLMGPPVLLDVGEFLVKFISVVRRSAAKTQSSLFLVDAHDFMIFIFIYFSYGRVGELKKCLKLNQTEWTPGTAGSVLHQTSHVRSRKKSLDLSEFQK